MFGESDKKNIKIVDFGIAGFCLTNLKEKTNAGTFKYMAPEVLNGDISIANPSMDIWALGMMMFMMLYGFHPFLPERFRYNKDAYDLKSLIQNIINNKFEIPETTLEEYSININK
jgi:serine/threonine protein kinase